MDMIRAVATSAVREARNTDMFLDRVAIATSIDVEVIDTAEESRLIVAPLSQAISNILTNEKSNILVAEVGGGSTLLTVMHQSEIIATQSLPLGSIRLQEALITGNETPLQAGETFSLRIQNEISGVKSLLPLKDIQTVVAIGGDARFAAREIGQPGKSPEISIIKKKSFDKLVDKCLAHSPEELAAKYSLAFTDAETLNPALLVYRTLLDTVQAKEMMVSQVSMRDGLLLDMARRVTGREDRSLTEGVIHSAMSVAKKYQVDLDHSIKVAELAIQLFDLLKSEHHLSDRERLLLRVAALLHETDHFISTRAHHKHSFYLIKNSELFGFSRDEHNLVAHVARYHRRSAPKSTHLEYVNLSREQRMLISKMAALLRVADALHATHAHQPLNFRFERQDDTLIIYVAGVTDMYLERLSVSFKGDMFEDIFGIKIRLEEDHEK